jgi:TRAP-type C4-dicarboxylate transport system permease small subunit
MSEHANECARPTDAVGRVLYKIARFLAIIGGILTGAMALMVTVSVTGRYLFASPIPGDYDLLAIMTGCAVFAFLPYCQMIRGNVVVDFFTDNCSPRSKAVMDTFGTLLYVLIAILFTWRLYFGGMELYANNEVLANFNFYRWWTVPFAMFCNVILILVIAYTLNREIATIRKGQA